MVHILVGKTILDVKIADDKLALKFITDAGDIIARCDGDCCSSTWIENVELPLHGFPAVVTEVLNLDLTPAEETKNEDYTYTQYYGCKIVTLSGDIIIDFRNESNGYYGGNLSWPGGYYYGGVYGQNVSTDVWISVEDAALGKGN